MQIRIRLARLLINLGKLFQLISLMVMRPTDLIEFSRQSYAREKSIRNWSIHKLVDAGLRPEESHLLEKMPISSGRLLLLGIGGGREAIPLARFGFEITGVDFVPELLDLAKQNAARYGLEIQGVVQEISQLEVDKSSFDAVWLSTAMYSSIPTMRKRVMMLNSIHDALRPSGYFVCQFLWKAGKINSIRVEKVKKIIACLSLGNIYYEQGDMLWHDNEFVHSFSAENELRREFSEAKFEIHYLYLPEQSIYGGAVLKKPERGL